MLEPSQTLQDYADEFYFAGGDPIVNVDKEEAKRKLYTTARAVIGCAEFKAGDVVSVRYSHRNTSFWYEITSSEHGPLRVCVMYPEQHLAAFCF